MAGLRAAKPSRRERSLKLGDTAAQIQGQWFTHPRRACLAIAAALLLLAKWQMYCNRVASRPSKWTSDRVARFAGGCFSLLGAALGVKGTVAAAHGNIPKRQVMFVSHPHGLYLVAPLLLTTKLFADESSPLYGLFTVGADAIFQVPLFRELLLSLNVRKANAKVIDQLLGHGRSVSLFPGGIHEQLASDPTQEHVFFPPKLGFVRQAMKHGVPLVPAYHFGENQQYGNPTCLKKLSKWIKSTTGAGLPLGTGRWGLPLIPKKYPIQVHYGKPIDVGPADPAPTDERVLGVFRAYIAELRRLFDEHKNAALPPDVAPRGLKITWRGHADEELSDSACPSMFTAALPSTPAVLSRSRL